MTSTRSEVSIWQELRERRVVRVGLVYLPDSTPLFWYGENLLLAGYAAEALEVLARAAAMDPTSGVIQGWLAHAHRALGNMEEDETHSRRALDRDWPAAARFFAVELVRRGELERASEWWHEFDLAESGVPDFRTLIEPERRREFLEAADLSVGPLPHEELLLWGREEEYLDRAFAAFHGGYSSRGPCGPPGRTLVCGCASTRGSSSSPARLA
jgi:tetratricopeptide (TPR) repeat protein